MKTPTAYEVEKLFHSVYDPVKAHQYYELHKKLTGRKPGQGEAPLEKRTRGNDPRRGKSRRQIRRDARAKQKKELAQSIHGLEQKLQKLEKKIKAKEHAEASENRKGKAKKERAAKEKDKPKSAAEKAKAARENEKFRKKNQQKLKTKSKNDDKSKGGSSQGKAKDGKKTHSVSELKSLATRVRGQIQVAKQKLAAL